MRYFPPHPICLRQSGQCPYTYLTGTMSSELALQDIPSIGHIKLVELLLSSDLNDIKKTPGSLKYDTFMQKLVRVL